MKPLLALLLLTVLAGLAACGAADPPSVDGGVSMGGFWRG